MNPHLRMRFATPVMSFIKKNIFPAFIFTSFLFAAGCSISDPGKKDTVISDETWIQELRERDTALSELMKTISMVEASLEDIKLREGLLVLPTNFEYDASKRNQILYDLQVISLLLQDNRKRLDEIDLNLKSSGIETNALRHQITQLNTILYSYEQTMDSLWSNIDARDAEIARMNLELEKMENTLVAHESVIESQDKRLNKAFYAMGTKKELRLKGVLDKKFRLAGSKLNPDINEKEFTEIDIREVRTIPVFSKRAKLVSHHSDDSFEWKKEKNKITALEIKDPEKFWKSSKFLIIELN